MYYRRPRFSNSSSSNNNSGKGRWNDSIPNNIILVRGLPDEADENDVGCFPLPYIAISPYIKYVIAQCSVRGSLTTYLLIYLLACLPIYLLLSGHPFMTSTKKSRF